MSASTGHSETLLQIRQRIDKLLQKLHSEREGLANQTKLDTSVAGRGMQSLDSVEAALGKTAAAADKAKQGPS